MSEIKSEVFGPQVQPQESDLQPKIKTVKTEKLSHDHFLIKEIIESFIEDWKAKSGQRDHQKRANFYVSDVSKCDRAIFYDFTCPEKKRPISAKTLMMFNAGNLLHDDLQDRARKRGLIEAARDIEYGLEDLKHKATGRLDFIAAVYKFIETDKGIAVAEIKTKNPYGFGVEGPNEEEIDQLLWYIDRLKESSARSIRQSTVLDYGFILYLDRSATADPLPLCGWKIDYDAERIKIIHARFTTLDSMILAGECPMRPHERDSIKCQYCRYIDHCWEGIPKPEAPAFIADETAEPPEKELVDSMAQHLIRMKEAKALAEVEIEKAEEILMKYFKATGQESLTIADKQIVRGLTRHTEIDDAFLYAELAKQIRGAKNLLEFWKAISVPKLSLLQRAIKDGKLDAGLFEQAKHVSWLESIRIKKNKEE